MHVVVFDANFLLIPGQLQWDVYQTCRDLISPLVRLVVFQATLEELDRKVIRNPQNHKFERELRLTRQFLSHASVELIPNEAPPGVNMDAWIHDQVKSLQQNQPENTVYLATNDRELRKRCRTTGIRVIYVRQKRKLAVE